MQQKTYIELSRVEVADHARQLWRADGSPTGRSLEYWLQAEVELLNARDRLGKCKPAPSGVPPWRILHALVLRPSTSGVASARARRNGIRQTRAPAEVGSGNILPELGGA